jgi:hypothetical protein
MFLHMTSKVYAIQKNGKTRYVVIHPVQENPSASQIKHKVKYHVHRAADRVRAAGKKVTSGSYFSKNGKEVGSAALVVGGVALVGLGVYWVGSALIGSLNQSGGTGSQNTPYCNQLESQLAGLYQQIGSYNVAAYKAGGVYTTAAQAAIVSLQHQIAVVSGNITAQCSTPVTPGVGTTVAQAFANFAAAATTALYYLIYIGAITLGAYGAIRVFNYWKKTVGSGSDANGLSTNGADIDVAVDFNPAAIGNIIANASGIADAANGVRNAQDVRDALQSLAASDPAAASATESALGSYFRGLASATDDLELQSAYAELADDFDLASAGDAAAFSDASDILDLL